MKFEEVTREEKWSFVANSKLDLVCVVSGNHPYTIFWKTRYSGVVVTIDVPRREHFGIDIYRYKYYIKKEKINGNYSKCNY